MHFEPPVDYKSYRWGKQRAQVIPQLLPLSTHTLRSSYYAYALTPLRQLT